MLSSSIFVFPFVVAIKPSQVSPRSSKSLATQDTPVRILTSSNDIYFPATSSLFHEGTVSSSVQPSAFPSSSVQMEGKARLSFFKVANRNIALKLALFVQIKKQPKKPTNKTQQKMEVGRNENVVPVFLSDCTRLRKKNAIIVHQTQSIKMSYDV